MNKNEKLKPGDEVTFNTRIFAQMGFWKGAIYTVTAIVDNARVALNGYPKNIIHKRHLETLETE